MHEDLLRRVVAVAPRGGRRVFLQFDDGIRGEVDLGAIIDGFDGVFAPLVDAKRFAQVGLDSETGTVCWPNGADIDTVVLYCAVKGIPVPDYEQGKRRKTSSRPTGRSRTERPASTEAKRRRRSA